MENMTEVTKKTPAELKEKARVNRIAALERARAAKKAKAAEAIPEFSKSSDGDIKFFSETDLRFDDKGNIVGRKCDWAQWMIPKITEDIEEEIRQTEFNIKAGRVAQGKLESVRQGLQAKQKQLAKLQEQTPNFDKHKDLINKISKDVGEKIAETMSTRSEQKKGLADAHRDVEIESKPSIDISSLPQVQRMAASNGVRIVKGKITGGDAVRIWQWSKKALGENSNPDILRRD